MCQNIGLKSIFCFLMTKCVTLLLFEVKMCQKFGSKVKFLLFNDNICQFIGFKVNILVLRSIFCFLMTKFLTFFLF